MRAMLALAAIATLVAVPGNASDDEVLAKSHGYYVTSDLVLHRPDGSTIRLPGEKAGWGALFTPSGRYVIYPAWHADGSGCDVNSFDVISGTLAAVLTRDCSQPREFAVFTCGHEEYFFWTTHYDRYDAVEIANVATGDGVFDGTYDHWHFEKWSTDRNGFFYSRRDYTCDSHEIETKGEARFDSLTEWDWRWIHPRDAQRLIQKPLKAVVGALQRKDWKTLGKLVHPDGVRRSEIWYVTECDPVFTPRQIAEAVQDTTHHFLGTADGSGEEIRGTLGETLSFYSNLAYENADSVTFNQVVGGGNTANNVFQSYPGSIVVEYYFKGTGETRDFNWYSLHLVFLPYRHEWRLAGITHGYWTI
jgi:hypothetical protein